MPNRIRRSFPYCSTIAVGSAVLIAILATPVVTAERPQASGPSLDIKPELLQSGDLIFRRGRSLTSRMVFLADPSSTYSHVGLLFVDGPEVQVIHVVPGDAAAATAPVRIEPLASFVEARHATAVSVRRLEHERAGRYAAQAAAAAYSYARASVPFDAHFDLQSKDRLYCTELVWRAYLDAGIDLVDGVFRRIQTPFGVGDYLPPSSLLNSRHLREVLSLSP